MQEHNFEEIETLSVNKQFYTLITKDGKAFKFRKWLLDSLLEKVKSYEQKTEPGKASTECLPCKGAGSAP